MSEFPGIELNSKWIPDDTMILISANCWRSTALEIRSLKSSRIT